MEMKMAEFFLQEALDIVKAQASVRSMTEEEIVQMVRSLARTLAGLSAGGSTGEEGSSPDVPRDKGLKEASLICLECGKTFKIITRRHLAAHGLTAAEYREKWGIKRKTALVCKSLQRMRRKKMKEMQLWKKRTQAAASAPQKRGKKA
jgi:predicted transcriptional regulator